MIYSEKASNNVTHISNLSRTSNNFFDILDLKLIFFDIAIKHA